MASLDVDSIRTLGGRVDPWVGFIVASASAVYWGLVATPVTAGLSLYAAVAVVLYLGYSTVREEL